MENAESERRELEGLMAELEQTRSRCRAAEEALEAQKQIVTQKCAEAAQTIRDVMEMRAAEDPEAIARAVAAVRRRYRERLTLSLRGLLQDVRRRYFNRLVRVVQLRRLAALRRASETRFAVYGRAHAEATRRACFVDWRFWATRCGGSRALTKARARVVASTDLVEGLNAQNCDLARTVALLAEEKKQMQGLLSAAKADRRRAEDKVRGLSQTQTDGLAAARKERKRRTRNLIAVLYIADPHPVPVRRLFASWRLRGAASLGARLAETRAVERLAHVLGVEPDTFDQALASVQSLLRDGEERAAETNKARAEMEAARAAAEAAEAARDGAMEEASRASWRMRLLEEAVEASQRVERETREHAEQLQDTLDRNEAKLRQISTERDHRSRSPAARRSLGPSSGSGWRMLSSAAPPSGVGSALATRLPPKRPAPTLSAAESRRQQPKMLGAGR
eukprot:TRINITY_DN16473_c0_g1_i2.p1 TRINITY_DN16473_c0_g1~~TRINITY_DN16473_c0_g1_i2.p1  ORF type:complete len:451 (+),score=117.84 TRINITY_DN16473_c0_g1_i2:522-1874(+)